MAAKSTHVSPDASAAPRRVPRVFAFSLGVGALALLVFQMGFVGQVTPELHAGTAVLALLFALEQVWAWKLGRAKPSWTSKGGLLLAEAVLVLAVMLGLVIAGWLGDHDTKLELLAHALVQGIILATLTLRGLRHQARLTAVTLRPGWLLIGSFSFIILVGTFLLKMPRAVEAGMHLTWLDAFFTSTSAVCVTGLTLHNTADFFTPTGQMILLALFQTGGLGIMTLTFFMAALLFQGMSLHDRFLLGEMIAEKRLAHVGETLRFIVVFTFVTEALGALAIFFALPNDHPAAERAFHAVFHSVSAFCNAGFSTFQNGMADDWVRNKTLIQVILFLLSVFGGLGSLVVYDGLSFLQQRFRRWRDPDRQRPRLRVHTRLVFVMTIGLLVGATPLYYMSEYLFHIGESNGGEWMTAFFYAGAARTSGFNTVDMGDIGAVTIHVLVLLMLIGGSPGGTAGGLRTTVVAVAALHLWQQLRGIGRIVLFRRRLSEDVGSRALGVIVLAMGWLFVNFAILRQLQPVTSDTVLFFELVSAFSTAGLSLNLTPELTSGAKILILLNMFIGRVGLLTIIVTLMPLGKKSKHVYPQEDILLV